jgi:hypothetical protein
LNVNKYYFSSNKPKNDSNNSGKGTNREENSNSEINKPKFDKK